MTKRPTKDPSTGMYNIHGKKFPILIGSRRQVFSDETAYKTPGGLVKSDLIKNRWGRIVSAKKHEHASKNNNLKKHGWCAGKYDHELKKIVPQHCTTKNASKKTRKTKKTKK